MHYAVNEAGIIEYDALFREYLFNISENSAVQLYFCPWCGVKFKKRLSNEYFDILEKEYGVTIPDLDNFTNIPDEFKTDEWWKKRGL
jgi:hypothetical protein